MWCFRHRSKAVDANSRAARSSRRFYSSYDTVEETYRYYRGALTYMAAQGDGWWYDWLKHRNGTWDHRWGGNEEAWQYKITREWPQRKRISFAQRLSWPSFLFIAASTVGIIVAVLVEYCRG